MTEEEKIRLLQERVIAYNEQLTCILASAALVELTLEEDPRAPPNLEKLVELLKRSNVISGKMIEYYRDKLPELRRAVENLLMQENLGVR